MACEQPRKIINRRYKEMSRGEVMTYSWSRYGMMWPPDYIVEVPCGYCHSCQKSVNNQYRLRLLYELRRWPVNSCLFVTLTFDDDNLARFEKDPNRAVRLFLDRARKRFGKQIRHWFIGEYGTLNGRPHYHGILFNVPESLRVHYDVDHPGDHPIIRSLWSYGFVFVGYVSDATCSYITKYLTKSINGNRIRPRVITSKGMGVNYLDFPEAKLHRLSDSFQPFVVYNGFKQAMPRYWYNKIFTEDDKTKMVLERYYHPVYSWRGDLFDTEVEMSVVRRRYYLSNVRSGLTPSVKPPTRKIRSSFSSFIDRMSTYFDSPDSDWFSFEDGFN